ncbi:hypothetical protein C0Q70_05431 [Pomacea canaliculata]|uniref:Uncharacterized protein n=1 Tax=Pomacea canaliculata TaxID=400727 RepID=A0A2T7PL74_POMCA|nr:hypothetical protein C0Q70_05431 [Pomacea canaliculata]
MHAPLSNYYFFPSAKKCGAPEQTRTGRWKPHPTRNCLCQSARVAYLPPQPKLSSAPVCLLSAVGNRSAKREWCHQALDLSLKLKQTPLRV